MNNRLRVFLLTLIIATLVISGGFYLDHDKTLASDRTSTDIFLGVNSSQGVVVNIYYDTQEQLDAIAGELDIWEVHPMPDLGPGAGYIVTAVYPAQRDWLEVLGYHLEINQEKTALLQSPEAALDPRYYYFDTENINSNNRYIVDFLQQRNSAYPNITELLNIGHAWLGENGGHDRDMWVLRITSENPVYGPVASKPTFFMMANIHAREVTTPEMAIRYIKYLTSGYNGQGGYNLDPDVTWLVNHHVVYVLISQNPDGHAMNEDDIDYYWRKNVDNNDGCGDPYYWGVDLNRNSSFMFNCCGGSSGSPCAETYRGPSKASEPETVAFQNFASTIFQDWNGPNGDNELPPASPDDASGIFITLHTYADEILWAWGFGPGESPNNPQLRTIGRKLADLTGVMNPSGFIGYAVDGSSDDWVYGKLGVAAFTYEIGPDFGTCGAFFPSFDCQDGINGAPRNFWAEMLQSFIYADKIAGTPYITSYGPDTQGLSASPYIPIGTPADLSGTVLDNRYGSDTLQPITGAEYFIDAPGADGTGSAMTPADGAWGESNEPVSAEIDTSDLSEGKHYVMVHGKNNDGIWGPFTAVFLDVVPPAPRAEFTSNSPVPIGNPMSFTNQTTGSKPRSYSWDFGDGVGTSTLANPSYTYSDVGTYTVVLTAQNVFGIDSISHSVTVVPPLLTELNLTLVNTSTLYAGVPVTFTIDLMPDEAGKPYTYTVNYGDDSVITNTTSLDPLSLTHIFPAAGNYSVQFHAHNLGMTTPVSDTLGLTVDESPYPVAEFVSNSPVLQGNELEFINNTTGLEPITYTWDFGDGETSTEVNPVHSYKLSGTYSVMLTATNAFGQNSIIYTVTVEPRIYNVFLPLTEK